MSKTLLLTHYLPNYQPLAELTNPLREAYCANWNATGRDYIFRAQMGEYKPELRLPFGFQRIKLIRDILDEPNAPEVVVWQGVDTVILNPNWRIGAFINGRYEKHYDFYIAYDCHGLNGDVFIIRNTDWSRRWLDFILSKVPRSQPGYSEQKVMQDYWQMEGFVHKILTLPQGLLNAYDYRWYPPWNEMTPGHIQHGDWLIHLVGLPLEQRLSIMRSDYIKQLTVPWFDGGIQ